MCFQLRHNRDNPFFYNNQKGKHFLDTRPEATNESNAWETGNNSDLWLPHLTLREFSGHNTWRQKCNSLANSLSWGDSAEYPGRPAHLECSGQNTRREICTKNSRDLEGVLFNMRGAWQPIPVFLPGESHGQWSWAGYSPWGCKGLDTTQWLTHTLQIFCRVLSRACM